LEQRFKQRLLGAVVLVALAVIFLPMLLSGPVERTRVDIELDMPPEPEVDAAPTLPTIDDFNAQEAPSSNAGQSAETAQQTLEVPAPTEPQSTAEPEPDPQPEPEAEPVPEPAPATAAGFYVQVGAFGSAENAERLARQLREDALSVRVVEESGAHRVQVGPLEDRASAERMTQQLAQDHELPGFIIEP